MKRLLLILCCFIFILSAQANTIFVQTPTGGEECTTENDSQQYPFLGTSTAARECTDTTWYGQTFQLGSAITTTGVYLYCSKDSSSSGSYSVHLYAYDTGTDRPTGDELASSTVDVGSLPAYGSPAEFFWEWASVAELSAGWYIVYGVGGSGTNNSLNIYRDSNAITGTYISTSDSGTNWTENASYDLRGGGIYGCSE